MKPNTFKLFLLAAFIPLLVLSMPGFTAGGKKADMAKEKSADVKSTTVLMQPGQSVVKQSANESRAGEQINWQVISGGGLINGTSDNFRLSNTVGQTAAGYGTSTNFGLSHGFWQVFDGGSCCTKPGDANNDGSVNVGDAVYMINYVFKGGNAPDCGDEGDSNGDCSLNVGDAVFLINYIFKGGNAPDCGCVGW